MFFRYLQYAGLFFLFCSAPVLAVGSSENKAIENTVVWREAGNWYLNAKQLKLSFVLNRLSDKTGGLIHAEAIPDRLVTAVCVGESIATILDCLLGDTVNRVFRYPESVAGLKQKPAYEVWLLGSSLVQLEPNSAECVDVNQIQQLDTNVQTLASNQKTIQKKLDFNKKIAMSENPAHRAQAISYLGSNGFAQDGDAKEILQYALQDENAEVRGQAITALVRQQGEQASILELTQALQDEDATVRMMALQLVKESAVMIQQALQDENKFVRQMAEIKQQ